MKKTRDVSVLVIGLMTIIPAIGNAQDLGPQPIAAPPGYIQPAAPGDQAPQPLAAPVDPAQQAQFNAQQFAQPLADPGTAQDMAQYGGQYGQPQQQAPAQTYTQQQLDQLVAPIALYPDEMISQILMASTYPLEVVEAQRWRQDPQNAQLQGDALQGALEQQPWDPSVKSLVPFPQVLAMMNNNLQWTEQLGDAFLGSQPALMDSIQGLRQKAQATGNLKTTPQQVVQHQQGDIVIQPANPQVVYVPYYNPQIVYGTWPYPAYPPYYFPPPPGYAPGYAGLFFFGVGIGVADWFWGWDRWDWHRHSIFIDDHRFAALNRGIAPHFAGGAWAHDVDHRHGVPYRNVAVRAQYGRAAAQARTSYRGYFNTPNRSAQNGSSFHSAAVNGGQRPSGNFQRPATGGNGFAQNRAAAPESRNFNTETHSAASPAVTSRTTSNVSAAPSMQRSETQQASHMAMQHTAQSHAAPMFESFSRGAEVQTQSARGSTSRASMANFSRSSAAPQAAHGGGGNGGGGRPAGGGGNAGGGGGHDHH